jgi:serine/threonine protein kinase
VESSGILDAPSPGDRFQILGKLGAGGMGVVYRAHDRERGSEVALKVLRHVTGRDIYRFKREFRALADVAHPNLVGLYDLHASGDDWFLTMELVDGVSFVDWVRPRVAPPLVPELSDDRTVPVPTDSTSPTQASVAVRPPGMSLHRHSVIHSPLAADRLGDALYQLCDTVHALHQAGKLHRDLKPSNILVDGSGRVVVLDFGLVAEVGFGDSERTHEVSHAVGTPAYMSPEQAADGPLSPASDWYSVGVILYEALTGRRPIDVTGAGDRPSVDTPPPPPPQVVSRDVPASIAALCMALLSPHPANRPDGEAVLAALGREPSHASRELTLSLSQLPFVGREAELERLRAAFARTRTGRGSALFVRGGSGMGKSALVRRFLEELATDAPEAVLLRGRCYESESVPFKTLDTMVDALTSHLVGLPGEVLAQLLPAEVGALARLFPAMRRVRAIAEPRVPMLVPPDPLELRRRAFAALRLLLTRLARRAPLVIALDDLQWGDVDSGNFLAELLIHEEAPPLLLLLTARSEDEAQSPLLAAVRRAHALLHGAERGDAMEVEDLTLSPLSNAEARQLVRLVGGPSAAGADAASDVVRDAGGSPLFLSEMVRGGEGAKSLDDAVRARVARLPEAARALAQLCAVAAHPLKLSVALRAAGVRQEGKLLVTLRSERLLRVRRAGDVEPQLETYHDRIRAAIVSGLDERARQRLHLALGEALSEEAAPDLEALVVHWLAAGKPARAARYAVPAAAAAEERLAFHRAADLYQLALEQGELVESERHPLLARMGHALVHAGNLAAAAHAFGAAAAGATALAERLELRRLELEQLLRSGQYKEGLALSTELLQGLGFRVPDSRGGAILAMLTQRALLSLRGLGFRARAAEDIPVETLHRIDLLLSLSIGMSFVNPVFGRALQTRLVREALACGEPRRAGVALSLEVGYLAANGVKSATAGLALGARTAELGRRLGNLRIMGHSQVASALVCFLSGRWKEAQEQSAVGEQTLRDHGADVRWEIDQVEFFAAAIAWQLGDARELVRRVSTHLRDAEERGDVYSQRGLRGWRANVAWLVIDQPAEARVQLAMVAQPLAAGENAQLSHYYELLSAGQIDLYEGDAAAAVARIDALWPAIHEAMLTRIPSVRIEGGYLRARAALALAASDGTDPATRARLVREAADFARRLRRERMVWSEALAAAVRAGVARVNGDAEAEPRALLAAALRFDEAQMTLYAAATRRRLARLVGDETMAAEAAAAFAAQAIPNVPALCRLMLGFAE